LWLFANKKNVFYKNTLAYYFPNPLALAIATESHLLAQDNTQIEMKRSYMYCVPQVEGQVQSCLSRVNSMQLCNSKTFVKVYTDGEMTLPVCGQGIIIVKAIYIDFTLKKQK
jgi:hypothetical protein